ncbi:MAG: hypothetical protein PF961_12000, partial [Planctomycetota bacterium]|nr:hypothetical protein [Planctomycetota bacterium]
AAPIVAATAAPTIQADAPAAPSAPDATPAAAPPSTPAPTNQPLVADPGTNPNPTPAAAASDGQLQPAEDPSLLVMAEIQRALSDNDDALVRRWLHELPADHPERQRVESALSDLDLRGDALANALEQAIADGSWGRAERLLMQVRKHEPRLLMDRLRMTKIDIHKGQARMLRQITDATTALKEQRWRDVVRNLEQVPTAYDIATIAVREQRAALQRTLFTTVDPLLDQQFELARQAIAANKPRSARDALDAATDLALAADRLDELAALRLQLP